MLLGLGMAECLFKQPKHSFWNIECSDTEYVHWSSCEYPLGTVSLTGVSVSGVAMAVTKKYQKNLMKVAKLVDIVTSALAMFEISVSEVLKDGGADEQQFAMLQTFHLGALNELANVDHKMEAEMRANFQKVTLKEINDFKKVVRDAS